MNLYAAYRSTGTAQVQFDANVTSAPREFIGGQTGIAHEAFDAQTSAGPVEIVDNIDIAPRVPVAVGDRIEVRGEMVHDPGRPPVVHWTHHDPSGRHPDGFIRLGDRVYA